MTIEEITYQSDALETVSLPHFTFHDHFILSFERLIPPCEHFANLLAEDLPFLAIFLDITAIWMVMNDCFS